MCLCKNVKFCHFIRNLVSRPWSDTQPLIDFSAFNKKVSKKECCWFLLSRELFLACFPSSVHHRHSQKLEHWGQGSGDLISTSDSQVCFEQDQSTATSYARIYPSLKLML